LAALPCTSAILQALLLPTLFTKLLGFKSFLFAKLLALFTTRLSNLTYDFAFSRARFSGLGYIADFLSVRFWVLNLNALAFPGAIVLRRLALSQHYTT
jgi:hypothetical protein